MSRRQRAVQSAVGARSSRGIGTVARSARKAAGFATLVVALVGCDWFTDFKQQPKIDPWESPADSIPPRHNPQASVPIYGSSAPGFAYDRAPTVAAINTMASLTNPIPPDARSMRNGAQQYAINCAVCHGPTGAGDGPVTRFGYPPMPIGRGSSAATTHSDGYLFGIIRNGRGLMPPYNRIEERDRWDLINYLRALQAGTANVPGPVTGLPGQTGELVPGASMTAPTRPVPHFQLPSAAPGAPGTAITPGTTTGGRTTPPAAPPPAPHNP